MKIKSVSESDILIGNNKSERVYCKINVKNRSELSVKIDADGISEFGISIRMDSQSEPKGIYIFA